MALAWAMVWAPVAVLFGLVVDPDGSMDEMWVAIGAYPGFLCGAVFCAVLGTAGGGRGLHELPLARVAAWGAAVGLLVGASELPLWQLASAVIGSITLLSALSAVASAMVARHLAGRRPLARAAAQG
jgi:hypothetical protein